MVELLLAVAILGMVVAPLLGMFSTSAVNNAQASKYTIAFNLAREKMESIKNINYDSVETLEQEPVDGYPQFSHSVDVAVHEAADNDQVELKNVTVTVYWEERNYSLSSYMTRR